LELKRSLAQRTLDDETSGKAPWHTTPFWGSEGENPARELRARMARLVAEITPEQAAAASPAVVPVLEWFIRNERLVPSRVGCMDALAKVRAKEADALIASLAADPGLPHGLAAVAIRQAAERKLDLPELILKAAVCDHHRDRRTAAGDYWQVRMPGEPPPAFDPLVALEAPPLRKLLDDLARMALDLPPTDARWGKVARKSQGSDNGKPVEHVETDWGWVLDRENKRLRLLTLHGRIHEFTLGKNQDWRGPATVSFTELAMENTVKMIEKLRAEGDSEHHLSEQGGFSGQFQGDAAGIPEMLLAVALDRSGKPDLCTRLRLMNCYQNMQPGDVDFLSLQYAEPCGLNEDAAWGGRLGKTQVINPAGGVDRQQGVAGSG
jgi:hypothetical protein